MYEDQTYNVIMDRMKAKALELFPGIDTREGSVIHTALGPSAAEIAQMYIQLDVVLNETFADKASRLNLIKRVAEIGTAPDPATYAVLKGVFTPSTLEMVIGTRFSGNGLNYAITEKISAGVYKVQCETVGVIGNKYLGDLVPVLYVPGLETCKLTEVLIPGEDEQATESLRTEYFDSFNDKAYGGNVADYTDKINDLDGVGGVKVYPVWDGPGTVKAVIINSSFGQPSAELIAAVQLAVDPVANSGQGYGAAPIDHVVTIAGVTETAVNVAATITYQSGYTWADIQTYVNSAIDAYFAELNQTWQSTKTLTVNNGLIVRISQIETRLLNIPGVLDITGTTLNGSSSNLTLGVDKIAVRGTTSG